jgi:hypothetical protein
MLSGELVAVLFTFFAMVSFTAIGSKTANIIANNVIPMAVFITSQFIVTMSSFEHGLMMNRILLLEL